MYFNLLCCCPFNGLNNHANVGCIRQFQYVFTYCDIPRFAVHVIVKAFGIKCPCMIAVCRAAVSFLTNC